MYVWIFHGNKASGPTIEPQFLNEIHACPVKAGFPLVLLTIRTGTGKEKENQFPLFWFERERKDNNNKAFL